ncbi:hypothetical protein [Pseudomonas agarici]|uniref:hypothetical protein n=1 Tax=Pseudomonas agarici TaxID=46677 RepID=UPI0003095BAF|nr:hypothetical protein [Pseudomonas agarici]NWB91103.1 hypothetical protein [Pseudomonas agarici]NWC09480.1 hypothetical protein [Pseudomonas agarici]SEL60129.1 hypothetical protein SAMN05216604_12412 [Pseudomonas agarici]
MHKVLAFSALALLLGGCASDPAKYDISGTWINQKAIDAAVKKGSLREALETYGPNLEWNVDTRNGQAKYSNGFERPEGHVREDGKQKWHVDFYGSTGTSLIRDGKELIQGASDSEPEQPFVRAQAELPVGAPVGASFEQALYSSYMGGDWKIVSGPGEGARVKFFADGRLEGLPGNDRYALCLAGDCASMSSGNDSIWLQQGDQGSAWIFVRKGKQLEIFQALNSAQADEQPQLYPGNRQWLLEK